jgi:hypothetical protein
MMSTAVTARSNKIAMEGYDRGKKQEDSPMAAALKVQMRIRRQQGAGSHSKAQATAKKLFAQKETEGSHCSGHTHSLTHGTGHLSRQGADTVLWVGGLPPSSYLHAAPSSTEIREAFETVGEVQAVLMKTRENGGSPSRAEGWALVVFKDAKSVADSIARTPVLAGVIPRVKSAFLVSAQQQILVSGYASRGRRAELALPWVWNSTVWLTGLSGKDCNPEEISEVCSQFGLVDKLMIRSNPSEVESWAIVSFKSTASALRAAQTEQVRLLGCCRPVGAHPKP